MKSNIPINEIAAGEDYRLMVLVTGAREKRTQQGALFVEAFTRNTTGNLLLKIRSEAMPEGAPAITPGLWCVSGRAEMFQDRIQLVVADYQPITLAEYREHLNADPVLPRAFTMDIETLALPGFRERIGPQLERRLRLGNMRMDQQQRYLEDIAAEEERCYQLGALGATSGRLLSLAVHVGPIPGLRFQGVEQIESEHVFGIDADGREQPEAEALTRWLNFMRDFDPETDELVGHNIIAFDLPFIFQRCLVSGINARPLVDLGEYRVRGVFDTMHRWALGDRRARVSLDDLAWALGIASSKTDEVEGSKVFDLYQAGRLAEIREYNLNDVRVTRKIYERIVAAFGR